MAPSTRPGPCRHGFIPPYLTERLLQSPDVAIRERALADLSFSAELRTERRMNAAMAGLLSLQAPSEEKRRRICVASAHTHLPGQPVRSEGDPDTGDAAVDEAYHFSGDVWDFYESLFKRRSLDGRGMTLLSTVHLAAPGGGPLDNAFWNGRQMAYGDGDGVLFNRFTCALDVIGHELTHGVQAYTCRLEYDGESGALNEHFADVFGILVKQWKFGVSAQDSDWLIGADVILPLSTTHRVPTNAITPTRINGEPLAGTAGRPLRRGIRDMLNPGTAFRQDPILGDDPQPAHYSRLYRGPLDNGGVHLNSGIPNRAFALTACALGGYAWEIAGKIWFEAMLSLQPRSSFRDCALATIKAAREFGPTAEAATRTGWTAVGVSAANSMAISATSAAAEINRS